MPVIKEVVNPNQVNVPHPQGSKDTCVLQVGAKLISLNGGIVLSICILLSAITGASVMTNSFAASQTIVFVILSVASWIYLLDSVSEKMELVGDAIVQSSALGSRVSVNLQDIKTLLLRHEGLNQKIGIESITIEYQDERRERIPLGPCWRRRELEAFLSSVEQVMGYKGTLELER